MAVRKRLMKAVFFFKEESSEGFVGKRSGPFLAPSLAIEVLLIYLPLSPAHALRLRSRSWP